MFSNEQRNMIASETIPIVLLPGMDGTGELLTKLANKLSMVRPVKIISYPMQPSLSYNDLTSFVVERVPKERFVILGESFSGPITIEIAAREPRVAGLVLASSFACHPIPRLFSPLAKIIDLRRIPATIVSAVLLGSTGTPDLKVHLSQLLKKLPREVNRTRIAEVLRVDKRKRLRQVSCPTPCICGKYDRLTGQLCLKQILAAQPRCQVLWLNASHMLLETHAELTADAIHKFCARLG